MGWGEAVALDGGSDGVVWTDREAFWKLKKEVVGGTSFLTKATGPMAV